MKYMLNAKQMKAVDEYAFMTIGIPPLILMEKASMKLVSVMLEKITRYDKIIVACGSGNNGGDGVAAARMLFMKGYKVDILLVGGRERMSEQLKVQIKIVENLGMSVFNFAKISEYNIVVDAMFGIGLKRPVTGDYEKCICEINSSVNTVFAVDVPSGISTDTGEILNRAVRADYTITFGYMKPGLVYFPGYEYAGKVIVADIGFPKQAEEKIKPNLFYYEKSDLDKLPLRKSYSHKGTYGKVLVVAGSKEICGACILAAQAAYRTGVGLVKVLTHAANRCSLQTVLPEVLVTDYTDEELFTEDGKQKIIHSVEWADVIVAGPGVGMSETSDVLINEMIRNRKKPIVMDADALNLLAKKDLSTFESTFFHDMVLTPHVKEMSRLLGKDVVDIQNSIEQTAREFVKDNEAVLVLKDARTIVSDKENVYVNLSGNNGMATGGSGDVLAGIIGGFLAQGMDLFQAATLAVYIHGLAGDLAASKKNCYFLLASDIIEALSDVLKT